MAVTHVRSRRVVAAGAATMLALAVFAGGAGATASTGSKIKCPGGKITFGEARALTGGFSFFDVSAQNGNILAIDAANKKGGIGGCKLKVIEGDTKGDPALGATVAGELIDKGAQFLFSPSDFDLGIGAASAAEAAGLIGTSEASSVEMPQAVGPHFFSAGTTTEGQGLLQGDFANEQGWKSAYVVVNDAFNFFTDMEDHFTGRFEGAISGRDVIADDQTDYAGVISKIRNANPAPDVIYLADYFPHVGTFIKQAREAGVDTPILGNNAYSALGFAELAGAGNVSNVFYVASVYWEGKDIDPKVAAVIKAYEKKFGSAPENNNFMVGYYSAQMLINGIKKANSVDADKVAKAMNSQRNVKLPGAVQSRWRDRHPERTVVVVGFDENGDFVQVQGPTDPQNS